MTTRSQKRKAVAELISGDFEASLAENNSTENLIASSSKNPRLELENLEEIKTTLRKEIISDLTKILAENQKEMLKLIAPVSKKRPISLNSQYSDSDQESISVARTSTPVKTQTATSSQTTPVNSRNKDQPGPSSTNTRPAYKEYMQMGGREKDQDHQFPKSLRSLGKNK